MFIAAIAFATILAVVAGLTISASTSFAHDFCTAVIHKGTARKPGEEVRVARVTAFAVAASANLPVIVLSLFWKRFNTTCVVLGLATGQSHRFATYAGGNFALDGLAPGSYTLAFRAKVRGQVLAGATKKMVWIAQELGSNIPGHWVEADSKEAAAHNTVRISNDDFRNSTQRAPDPHQEGGPGPGR